MGVPVPKRKPNVKETSSMVPIPDLNLTGGDAFLDTGTVNANFNPAPWNFGGVMDDNEAAHALSINGSGVRADTTLIAFLAIAAVVFFSTRGGK